MAGSWESPKGESLAAWWAGCLAGSKAECLAVDSVARWVVLRDGSKAACLAVLWAGTMAGETVN